VALGRNGNFALHIIDRLVSIIESESVYSEVRLESLNKTDKFGSEKVNNFQLILRRLL